MSVSFSLLVPPPLSLSAELADIKDSIRNARRNPLPLGVADRDFSSFAPRLEGNWGALYPRIPSFYEELLTGAWQGSRTQTVPASLLGDFGEYIGCRAFQARLAPNSGVARVLRAAALPRPDFLIQDRSSLHITALECKAHFSNGMRAREAVTKRGHVRLTLCGICRDRRRDGLDQIATGEVIDLDSCRRVLRLRGPTIRFRARVIAHASAIVTPVLLDGRLRPGALFAGHAVSKPRGCSKGCTECLFAASEAYIPCPIFRNDPERIEPLPPGPTSDRFFEAYVRVGKAILGGHPKPAIDGHLKTGQS